MSTCTVSFAPSVGHPLSPARCPPSGGASQHAPAMPARPQPLNTACCPLSHDVLPAALLFLSHFAHPPMPPLPPFPSRYPCRAPPRPPRHDSISEQTTNQAVEVKALVAALENHTYSVAAAVTDHVAVQTVQLRQAGGGAAQPLALREGARGAARGRAAGAAGGGGGGAEGAHGRGGVRRHGAPPPPLCLTAPSPPPTSLCSLPPACGPRWVGAIPGGGCHPRCAVVAIPGALWWPSQVRCGGHPRCQASSGRMELAVRGWDRWMDSTGGCEGVGPVDGQHRWL
ncbi:unnamed protein product [Closterium sp. NIES-65]|nr:unnamed protein product [Closterium sp. NIES-65]